MSASSRSDELGPRTVQQLPLLAGSTSAQNASSAQFKVPVGDGPYVRAKQIQLLEKDPERAIALFWAAINAGDRVDSALKDMAVVMKQQNRGEEAIQAILSFRHLCSPLAQESLDNVLLDLYKKCGRLDEQIDLLKHKLGLIHKGMVFNGKRTKTARSQGRKFQISIRQEATRLLGNLGWAYMQLCNYVAAEAVYRKALSIEEDSNKLCNLGVCFLKQGKEEEARAVLERVTPMSPDGRSDSESHVKSYQRSRALLHELSQKSPSLSANNQHQQILIIPQEFDLWTHWKLWEPPIIGSQNPRNAAVVKSTINGNPARIRTNPALRLSKTTNGSSDQLAAPLPSISTGDDVDTALTIGRHCTRQLAATNCSVSAAPYSSGAAGSFKREIGPSTTVQQPNYRAKKNPQSHADKSGFGLLVDATENVVMNVDAASRLESGEWAPNAILLSQKPVARELFGNTVSSTKDFSDNNCGHGGKGFANSMNQFMKIDVPSLRDEYQAQGAGSETDHVLDFSCVDKVIESVGSYVAASSAKETVSTMYMPIDAVGNAACILDEDSVNSIEGTIEKSHSDDYKQQGEDTWRAPVSPQRLTRIHSGQHRLKVFQDMTHDAAHNL
ncbi:hypothetical protein GOP47_0017531 [Adiantum capillus-veneris]|uniref:Protein POLLENLESS 3-LIKE 2 n=1 Tax=Adiantum capillus-veneris TaxID=13818 RepID=A0A9D4UFH9_ADICA|nr:hypothetical protein GOP47_0017531 [Adiantum capillus-veneris]